MALVVGTLASLAANVAVGGSDVIGKALAGWPALSMLVAVKLLFSMIDHVVDQRTVVADDQWPSADRPAVLQTVPGTALDAAASSGTVPVRRMVDSDISTSALVDQPAAPVLGRSAPARPGAGPVDRS